MRQWNRLPLWSSTVLLLTTHDSDESPLLFLNCL
jgi:hypothetical protein